MTRLMLIGVLRGAQPAPAGTPDHMRVAAGPWTGLALEVPATRDLEDAEAAAALAQRQHRVLCHYIAETDVLPVAMGAVFSGPEAMRADLRGDTGRLRELADRLSGQVEYTLAIRRAQGPHDLSPAAAGGADHLRRRRDKRDRARSHARRSAAFIDDLAAILAPITTAHRRRGPNREGRMGAIDLLLRRDDTSLCLSGIEAQADEAEELGLSLSVTGPYPALSFVTEPDIA